MVFLLLLKSGSFIISNLFLLYIQEVVLLRQSFPENSNFFMQVIIDSTLGIECFASSHQSFNFNVLILFSDQEGIQLFLQAKCCFTLNIHWIIISCSWSLFLWRSHALSFGGWAHLRVIIYKFVINLFVQIKLKYISL